jgi:hypothetical protein
MIQSLNADNIEKIYEFKIASDMRHGDMPMAWPNINFSPIKVRLGCFEQTSITATVKPGHTVADFKSFSSNVL